jgi:hypothetical protein
MMATDMVDLIVGQQKKLFRVHKYVLCKKVPYFDKMFKGAWKEASDKIGIVSEDTVEAFDLLIAWVYFDTIRPLERISSDRRFSWDPIPFWKLADKFCPPKLQDEIMDISHTSYHTSNVVLSHNQIESCYKDTLEGSPLRRYAVQTLIYVLFNFDNVLAWSITTFQAALKSNDDLAKDYLTAVRGIRQKSTPDPRMLPKCDFHAHEKGSPCSYAI